ncbi:MAG: hypothetical protein FWC00_05775 [Firmicutes bacterium]|nr:hypothetical protein [Bacillota bacterium]
MKREKSMLRKHASQAKSRLAAGFWDVGHSKVSLTNINDPMCADEQFYRRIETFLREGEENPLQHMLDADYMSTLSDADRQRYVLNMSFRVAKSIERYNNVC